MNQQELHEKVLYPVTRVKAGKAGGSGVLVYSKPDPKNSGQFINIILTCQHVIDGAISVKDEWDSLLKREIKKDIMEEVSVEIFDYDGSKIASANSSQAEIIAYDKQHDLAAVKLNNTRPQDHIAKIYPKEDIENMKLFDEVWTSGCSLLHDPFSNKGELTYLREMIDQKSYIMYNAPSIFGNSGGGVFHGNGGLLGLCSRITNIQLGFGIDVMTWMGFGTHPSRLYEFFEHQELQFIYDGSDYYDAKERRKERQRKSLRHLFIEEKDADKVDVSEDVG
ncbi:hypothetical protein CL614_09790 [archaeon]|nr:hypothetical protein [archaeon]|tara:strand:+ start:6398 stop:7234 length:837 start_codon:yes stop_codon:yes gene_type:complete